jgi:FeS assembly protein IscX
MKLKWTDVHEIGFQLSQAWPEIDPLRVKFTDLHRMVRELPDFGDDPSRSNEKILEAIQMAWLEERD